MWLFAVDLVRLIFIRRIWTIMVRTHYFRTLTGSIKSKKTCQVHRRSVPPNSTQGPVWWWPSDIKKLNKAINPIIRSNSGWACEVCILAFKIMADLLQTLFKVKYRFSFLQPVFSFDLQLLYKSFYRRTWNMYCPHCWQQSTIIFICNCSRDTESNTFYHHQASRCTNHDNTTYTLGKNGGNKTFFYLKWSSWHILTAVNKDYLII